MKVHVIGCILFLFPPSLFLSPSQNLSGLPVNLPQEGGAVAPPAPPPPAPAGNNNNRVKKIKDNKGNTAACTPPAVDTPPKIMFTFIKLLINFSFFWFGIIFFCCYSFPQKEIDRLN